MDYFPTFFDIRHRRALVVGGGQVAERKIQLLLRAGARVAVVAEQLTDNLNGRAAAGQLDAIGQAFHEDQLAGVALVIAATSDRDLNRAVAVASRTRGIPVNVVDDPKLSSFIVPAIIDRDPVMVAVSTGGASPVLARLMRRSLEQWLPEKLGAVARLARAWRERVGQRLGGIGRRRAFWEQLLESDAAKQAQAGQWRQANDSVSQLLETHATKRYSGSVALVGAGPGDPELLTLKALRLMQQADVVLYDRLVAPAIIDKCRRDAELVDVGKTSSGSSDTQSDITSMILKYATAGRRVVRLKGGDPFVFGRGGEELEAAEALGIEVTVVPGITAATGCAASAGIPLTHRDLAHGCVLATGQLRSDGDEAAAMAELAELAARKHTIVLYMGIGNLALQTQQLIAHGLSSSTPVAIVENGTRPEQRVLRSSLAAVANVATRERVRAPALVIIGEVARANAYSTQSAAA